MAFADKEALHIERLGVGSFIRTEAPPYADSAGLLNLYEKLWEQDSPPNLLLEGPKGLGKNLSLQAFAVKKGIPLIEFSCSEDVRRSQMVGAYTLRGQETVFVLGGITTAIEVANEAGSCILVLDEVNALTPQMQKVINPIADFRRRVEVPEVGRVFALEPGKKLFIVGTANTRSYGGVYALNEDLKSRFRIVPLSYPGPEAERAAIKAAAKALPSEKVITALINLAQETRAADAFAYALSTRDLVAMAEDWVLVSPKFAIMASLGKFEEHERDTFKARVTSLFGKGIFENSAG